MQFNGCVAGRPELLRQVVDRRPASARTPDTSRARVVPAVAAFSFVRLRGAQGAMLGQLAGDSLGSLVEFHGPEQIRAMYPEGVRNLEAGGVWNLLPGQPTDDSEMALVLARSIVEEGRYDPDAAAEAYIGWMQSGPFDIGTTTTLGIRALQGYGRPDPNSQSNGGLMRVAPIGIFAAGNPAQAAGLARLDTGLTHPNPVCLSASAAFCAAISVGIDGADHGTMVSVAHVHAGDDEAGQIVRQCLEQSLDGLPTDFTRQMGWVLIALSNAFHRLWHGQPIENALIETVGQGGDTDTNAAICGALLGAAQGRDAVPLRWRRSVMACRSAAGSGARHVRPAGYWPDDCIELAESLMEAGSSRGDRPRP